jgi:molybdopterin-binding protein
MEDVSLNRRLKYVAVAWIGVMLFGFLYATGFSSINDLYSRLTTHESEQVVAADIYTFVDIELPNGEELEAKVLEGEFKESILRGSVVVETEKETLTALVTEDDKIEGEDDFKFIPGTATTNQNQDVSVTDIAIADNSISGMKIIDGTITGGKLTDGIIVTRYLADAAVTSVKLADGSVTTQKLLDGVIVTSKIADGAITEIKLADGSVVTGKLADYSVTGDKIADATITDIQLADDSVVTAKIVDGAVTSIKLEDGSITLSKLSDLMCADGEILKKTAAAWECSTDVGTGSVTAGDGITNSGTASDPILNASVDDVTIEIVADTIQLKNGGVSSAIIENGTIVNDDIATLANIEWSKISKAGSSLADLATRDFNDLTNKLAQYVSIQDTTNYFTATDTEGVLQEIGANYFRLGGNSFGGTATLGTNDAQALAFETGGTTKMTILNSGNVGIGNTAPNNLLSLGIDSGAVGINEMFSLQRGTLNIGAMGIDVTNLTTYFASKSGSYGLGFRSGGSTSYHMLIATGGNVGIGASPLAKFHVNLGTNQNIIFQSHTSEATIASVNDAVSAHTSLKFIANGYNFYQAGGATATLTMLNSGNVGIGTTPTAKLEVTGTTDIVMMTIRNDSAGSNSNLTLWENNGGTDLSYMDDYGRLFLTMAGNNNSGLVVGGTTAASDTSAIIHAKTSAAKSLVVRGATSQTANLQEWQNVGGTPLSVVSASGALGIGVSIPTANLHTASTLTTLGGVNGLSYFDWSPSSAATVTSDLFSINIGANGNAANLFTVKDTGSILFGISESKITANLPMEFSAPGDVAFAYDLMFTNPSSSYIKSNSSIYIQAGEVFNSSDLTLRTFNSGSVVVDSASLILNGLLNCSSGIQTNASGATSCIASDQSLKNNVTTLTSSLDKVMSLRGVSYNWIDTENNGVQTEFGLIAQEVEGVVPELVFTMGTGIKGVKYQQLTGLLIEAIKEQQNTILELKATSGSTMSLSEYFSQTTIPEIRAMKLIVEDELITNNAKVVGESVLGGSVTVGANTAGKVKILEGQSSVVVSFNPEYPEAPIVTISPLGIGASGYGVTEVTKNSFKIELSTPATSDIEFNWIALGTYASPASYPTL